MRHRAMRTVGRGSVALASCLAALVLAAGCGSDDGGSAQSPPATATTPATAPPATVVVTVWFADQEARLRPERRAVPAGADPLRAAMDALAAGPDDPALLAALPEGTQVLGTAVGGGVATVDLSAEFESGYPPGGAAAETAVIGPIVRTASEASGAPRVRIRVEGRAPAPPGTQFDLSQPLAVGDLPAP